MVQNFNDKFAPFGVTCGELTGDVEDMRAATRHPIVCATPEKVRLEFHAHVPHTELATGSVLR